MRSLVKQIINDQRYLSILIFCGIILFIVIWYFSFYQHISEEYNISKELKEEILDEIDTYNGMKSQIGKLEGDWNILNDKFLKIIDRIPDKRLMENVTDYLYSIILNNSLKIINYSPSMVAIEKKNIFLPESENEILIEKIPIDITLRGSFLDFNQLLEKMKIGQYRLTTSNVKIEQKETSTVQSINLIAYAYFQTSKNKNTKKPAKIKKNKPEISSTKKETTKNKENSKLNEILDSDIAFLNEFENVPEMWLEPATEPVDTSEQIAESPPKKRTTKIINDDKIKLATKSENDQAKNSIQTSKQKEKDTPIKSYNDLNSIVAIDSKICKKVKNNLPLEIGVSYTTDVGKIFCHVLLNNYTGKHHDVWHIWYLNGELKSKVLIRVPPGKEIPAISNKKIEKTSKGKWKVEIRDKNKMILDTVIFEVV